MCDVIVFFPNFRPGLSSISESNNNNIIISNGNNLNLNHSNNNNHLELPSGGSSSTSNPVVVMAPNRPLPPTPDDDAHSDRTLVFKRVSYVV